MNDNKENNNSIKQGLLILEDDIVTVKVLLRLIKKQKSRMLKSRKLKEKCQDNCHGYLADSKYYTAILRYRKVL